ncbi:MAG: hypothetical protein ACM3MI_09165 [Clostridiales bacterium]|jgi:hypothetical protein
MSSFNLELQIEYWKNLALNVFKKASDPIIFKDSRQSKENISLG